MHKRTRSVRRKTSRREKRSNKTCKQKRMRGG